MRKLISSSFLDSFSCFCAHIHCFCSTLYNFIIIAITSSNVPEFYGAIAWQARFIVSISSSIHMLYLAELKWKSLNLIRPPLGISTNSGCCFAGIRLLLAVH